MVTIASTAALALLVMLWTRRRYGGGAALIALALMAFDPTLLAHGHFVTSDVLVTLFLFAAWVAWDAWLRRPSTGLLLAAGILAALAVSAKYSALILIVIFPVAWLLARPRPGIPVWTGLACLMLAPSLVILALYDFDTRSMSQDPILAGKVHGLFASIPIPGYYFSGAFTCYTVSGTAGISLIFWDRFGITPRRSISPWLSR